MAKTKITWNTSNMGVAGGYLNPLKAFIADGKTDGTPTITEDGNLRIVERNWVDTESAQAWIDFFKNAGATPVSAVIEE